MKVSHFEINKADERVQQGPFVFMSDLDGGCGLPACNCSPGHWITISDGDHALKVKLSMAEWKQLFKDRKLV